MQLPRAPGMGRAQVGGRARAVPGGREAAATPPTAQVCLFNISVYIQSMFSVKVSLY